MPNRGGSDPHGLAHIDQVPWDDADISMMEPGDGNENMDFYRKSGAKDSKKSKKRSNANNDGEMRDLFDTNKAKSLEDVANELRGNERGPKAERKRQLYAMLCFGKLVRILFPNIQTRRLGVRGESKYHYVNFDLKEQPATERGTSHPFHAPNDIPTEKSPEVDFNTTITKDPAPPSAQPPRLDDVANRRSGTRATDRWIEECDILLYQRCTRLIAHLSHQVIPQRVMSSMRKISERLVGHIHESFRGQPSHVLEAKIGPATVFAGIMDRMLRVNVSAHAMVREMTNVANRDQMFVDWVQNINPRKIAECVPTRGMDDVVNLLLTELRDVLEPENVPQTEDFVMYMSSRSQEIRQNGQESARRATGRSHIERLEAFLMSLPSKFPYASHADIACSWLVLKVFIDEEIWFLAEAGGFLRTTSIRGDVGQDDSEAPSKRVSSSSGAVPDNAGPTESASPLTAAPTSPRVSNRAPFPPKPSDNFADTTPDVHDDSGIGIRTPDTDFHKFTFGNAEQLVDVDGVLDGAGRSDRPDELMMNA
ncbi:DNA damage and replication checkpoint protein [Emericellopsis cladophorae]|uniref:DNA damage and replication checkpoint protein n=1 Tax=Emericellopsis cladophorae TaxID=2686198 RepID=A0A9Q0BFP2_9HYPO|nr:DNA damage and replication checkpoint protein [Emericellopsis cladophorae]KAI6782855.1 DNA damage and replication checkpoint protein [Emericellopsis cladophorae]